MICAAIASTKRRSVVGWFFVGFLLALIGLIIILALPTHRELGESIALVDPAESQRQSLDALERLSSLHVSGVLSEQEFQQKKQELLLRM